LTEDFTQVEHLTPMLSLASSYNAEDLNDWDASLKRFLNMDPDVDIAYGVEPKFDGGSIALVLRKTTYCVRAATRGNGAIGEEMTNNAKVIRSIPLKAEISKYGIYRVELRGEVLIRKDVFAKMNAQRAADGLQLLPMPAIPPPEACASKSPRR